jgi:Right handed beta helix region
MTARRLFIAALLGVVLLPAASGAATAPSRGCTLYASPTGATTASGRTPSRATSLRAADGRALPGTTVCLLRGIYQLSSTFVVTHSGMPGAPIVYRGIGGRALIQWTGEQGAHAVIWVGDGRHDLTFERLAIDGGDRAAVGIQCSSGYGLTVRASTIRDTGAAGVYTRGCDYVTVAGNLIHHTGYDPATGWSSAVSLNHIVWHDQYSGFHNFVAGNVISGASDESPHHTEGHGVVVDRGGAVPPVLIANNVLYENGGRAVEVYHARGIWIVNNTAYMNALDLREGEGGKVGDYTANGSDTSDVHFVNDVAFSWTDRPPYQVVNGASAFFDHDVEYGGGKSDVPDSVAGDPSQLQRANPRFEHPPTVDASAAQQQGGALAPWLLGDGLVPGARSALVDRGVDPSLVDGMTPELRAGLSRYLSRDVRGERRPRGSGWDIGAYER